MRTLSKLALAAAGAAALAGTAAAADRDTHVIKVALPDGSIAHIEYVGDVAPRVTVAPGAPVGFVMPVGVPMSGFGDMFAQMDREMAATLRQIDQISRQPLAAGSPGANLAAYGSVPAGTSSYSVVTVSENGRQCSRSTQVIGQGAGKPPKVLSNVRGDCGPAPSVTPAPKAPPAVAVPNGPIHQS